MKNIYILFVLLMLLHSCKTPEVATIPNLGKTLEMQPETITSKVAVEDVPKDLKSLFKQMALTELEEKQFLTVYRDAAKQIAAMKAMKLDDKADAIKTKEIYKARDVKVKSKLKPEQKRMYDTYLRHQARRKILNQSNSTETNY